MRFVVQILKLSLHNMKLLKVLLHGQFHSFILSCGSYKYFLFCSTPANSHCISFYLDNGLHINPLCSLYLQMVSRKFWDISFLLFLPYRYCSSFLPSITDEVTINSIRFFVLELMELLFGEPISFLCSYFQYYIHKLMSQGLLIKFMSQDLLNKLMS